MVAPAFDITRPAFDGTPVDQDQDQLRDNVAWLMIAAAGQGYVLPNWNTSTTGPDPAEPETIVMTQGSLRMRWSLTWNAGNVTQIVWEFDDGGGTYATLTGGTITLAYDGSSNFTGATAA